MNQQTMQIILEIIIVFIGLYLAFFKSYFQEKGKNLATLEDIEEITNKVESIKTEFIRETEKLKLDIQYTNQLKFSIKTEEMKSLFDFYEKYYLWINILLDFYFGDFDEDNQELLKNSQKNINETYFKFLLSEAKAELFINSVDLFKHTKEMKLATLEFQGFIIQSIGQYRIILFEITSMKATTPIQDQLEKYKALLEKKSEFINNYNAEKLIHYRKIAPMNKQFQKLSYEQLLLMSKANNAEELEIT